MNYKVLQKVTVVDLDGEIIEQVDFNHGTYAFHSLQVGYSVESKKLGLRNFTVVYDERQTDTVLFRVESITVSMITPETFALAYLEPVTLIIGQHDVGLV